MNLEATKQFIINFIRAQAGDKPVILGLSGGLDSSVIAYLAVEALGVDKVSVLIMPSDTNTAEDLELSKQVAENLNIQYSIFNIDELTKSYINALDFEVNKMTLGNLKARARMTLLYSKANEINGLVLGTGNKTEIMTGYSTKHGDAGCDILPIGDLYKTEERELAKYIGVPQEIIDRPPTAGLWEGQTDEEELGITYENLDKILIALENNVGLSDFDKNEVELVQNLIKNSEHKRHLPPICKL
jgi:NAD+ synthase